MPFSLSLRAAVFLSTPSARRATLTDASTIDTDINFYPRPPRGGRPYGGLYGLLRVFISIHALREEGDPAALRLL